MSARPGVAALATVATLTGAEAMVGFGLHPLLNRLPGDARRHARRLSARWFGRTMPVAYATSLAIATLAAVVGPQRRLWGACAGLQAGVILGTVVWLVPLNDAIASGCAQPARMEALMRRWDGRHRVRVAALVAATGLAASGLQPTSRQRISPRSA